MPKKIIPVPSDFARPKKGVYVKKGDVAKPKTQESFKEMKRSLAPKKKEAPKPKSNERYKPETKSAFVPKERFPVKKKDTKGDKQDEKMPLNKYIAHCGICSRRDAIELIKQGKVKVNNKVELEPGYKIVEGDVVMLEDKKIIPQEKLVYYLLNKPKDFITTTDDPEGRKTVMDLLKPVADKRIYPVGRLDRNTTGLLLLTNDGHLAQKLSHPKHQTRKVYQVGLDKPLNKNDFELIAKGVMLEDGVAEVDEVAYIDPKDKKSIGIEIHSGRNRIVRRIKTLDRVVYAGLTKKNLPRGKFRELEEKEVIYLKHFK